MCLFYYEQKRLDQITQQLESGTHEAEANRETNGDVSHLFITSSYWFRLFCCVKMSVCSSSCHL